MDDVFKVSPSLNPPDVRSIGNHNNLSQVSTTSRISLSLKKNPRRALKDISHTQSKVLNYTTHPVVHLENHQLNTLPEIKIDPAVPGSERKTVTTEVSTKRRISLSLKKKPRIALQDITRSQNLILSPFTHSTPLPVKLERKIEEIAETTTAFTEIQYRNLENQIEFAVPPVCQNKPESELSYNFSSLSTVIITQANEGQVFEPGRTADTPRKFMIAKDEQLSNNSINSCTTQLYDPHDSTSCGSDKATPQKPSHPSVIINKMDDKIILKCKLNDFASTSDEATKKTSNSQLPETKKIETESISDDDSVVLIMNHLIPKEYSHILVTPPNVTLVKRNRRKHSFKNTKKSPVKSQQNKITQFLNKRKKSSCKNITSLNVSNDDCVSISSEDVQVKATILESNQLDELTIFNSVVSPHNYKMASSADRLALPLVSQNRSKSFNSKIVPPHKVIAGTQIAVDAFSYGSIVNVKFYFLTHFHSDHYMGLRKSFSSKLYCTKITAELCMSRLGVNSRYINIINADETIHIDSVRVTAIDANHCPGSIMLVFSLSDGKNILHCGDFRASPDMESHPVFWNTDIHTVYLDTTYCNPRHNFPSQDECISKAVDILQQKKRDLQRKNKDFSKVLIVCGTYTIGKEKFFTGLSKLMDCSVWASTEKADILRTVLGGNFTQQSKIDCRLHVLDMRHLTNQHLKLHLDSMGGAFSEIVAFKPSGWEFGSKLPFHVDNVTIHNIPYSEHSSFPEMMRFVNFLRPKLVIPTVAIPAGVKSVQKYFPCPVASKEDWSQKRISEFFTSKRNHAPAVT